jgi:hypothetical protein
MHRRQRSCLRSRRQLRALLALSRPASPRRGSFGVFHGRVAPGVIALLALAVPAFAWRAAGIHRPS